MNTPDILNAVSRSGEEGAAFSAAIEAVPYGKVRTVLEESCALFCEGLNEADSTKTAAALRKLSKYLGDPKDPEYYENEVEAAVGRLTKLVKSFDEIREGRRGMNSYSGELHPFLGTPDETYEIVKKSCSLHSYYRSITSFTLGVTFFLWNFRDYHPDFKEMTYPYLEAWLKRFTEILFDEFNTIIGDTKDYYEMNDDPSGPDAVGRFFREISRYEEFRPVLTHAFNLAGKRVASIETHCLSPDSPLNIAVRTGNMEAFERFLSYGRVRKQVFMKRREVNSEEDVYRRGHIPGKHKGKISVYPVESMEMLERLFSLGLLIPGTEDAKEAFFKTISEFDPSREILERIVHPSYLTDRKAFRAARSNDAFSPLNFDLLGVTFDMKEDGRNLLENAIVEGKAMKFNRLIELGADVSRHDRWGNNILHLLYADGRMDNAETDFDRALSFDSIWDGDREISIYSHKSDSGREWILDCLSLLKEERNVFGRIPSDYSLASPSDCTPFVERYMPFNDILDMIFHSGKGDTLFHIDTKTDSFNPLDNGSYISLEKVFTCVRRYLEKNAGDITIVEVSGEKELDDVIEKSSDGKGRYAVLIPNLDNTEKIRELHERASVILLLGTSGCSRDALAFVSSLPDMNIFSSKSGNTLNGDILFSQKWKLSSLGGDSLLLKRKGHLYLTQFPIEQKADEECNENEDDVKE